MFNLVSAGPHNQFAGRQLFSTGPFESSLAACQAGQHDLATTIPAGGRHCPGFSITWVISLATTPDCLGYWEAAGPIPEQPGQVVPGPYEQPLRPCTKIISIPDSL